jgi:hypothetical protein
MYQYRLQVAWNYPMKNMAEEVSEVNSKSWVGRIVVILLQQ